MIDPGPAGETLAEIAARTATPPTTVQKTWRRHPEWPAPVGRRGRAATYDPAAVDAWLAAHVRRPVPKLKPGRLYTAAEIAAATGISAATIRADVHKGRWPRADDTTERAHRWYGGTVRSVVRDRNRYQSVSAAPHTDDTL
jgi:predicted DNA-binding transcriptional regulator AlpA